METSNNRIGILGSGAWGTTLGKVLAEAGNDVIIWGIEADITAQINDHHAQPKRLPGVILPANLKATLDIADLLDSSVILVAIAAQHAREGLTNLLPKFEDAYGAERSKWPIFVSVMKGMEQSTGMMMAEMIANVLGITSDNIACIAGPNLAKEVAKQMPCAATIASENAETAKNVANCFANSTYFDTEVSTDLKGVELVSCLKNVYALAAGYYTGQGYGNSTVATVITRAIAEAKVLLQASGSNIDTLTSFAGIGDLIATCMSPLSRNHSFGNRLGQGVPFEQAVSLSDGVSEGVPTVSVILDYAAKLGVKMPVAEEVGRIVQH